MSIIKLICVTGENNNKFYTMEDNGNGTFTATWGRVEKTSNITIYPISKWKSQYNSKIKKGYTDITELYINEKTENKYLDINIPSIKNIIDKLISFSKNVVLSNYSITSKNVTNKMITEAQNILNTLTIEQKLNIAKNKLEFDDFMHLCSIFTNLEYIDENINNTVTRTFNYRLDSKWSPLCKGVRNFRGTVFDLKTKKLLAIPYFKFFSINQNNWSSYNMVKNWKIDKIYEKIDGSLVYFYIIDNKLVCRTKRSCNNSQTNIAYNIVNNNKKLKDWIYFVIQELNCTPMFELISPRNKIIVNYTNEDLIFLSIRNMESYDIIYPEIKHITSGELSKEFFISPEITTIYPIKNNYNNIYEILKENENYVDNSELAEGYVVLFTNGELVKFKNKQYVELTKYKKYLTNDSKIAQLYFNKSLNLIVNQFKYNNNDIIDFVNTIIKSIEDIWINTNNIVKKLWENNYTFLN